MITSEKNLKQFSRLFYLARVFFASFFSRFVPLCYFLIRFVFPWQKMWKRFCHHHSKTKILEPSKWESSEPVRALVGTISGGVMGGTVGLGTMMLLGRMVTLMSGEPWGHVSISDKDWPWKEYNDLKFQSFCTKSFVLGGAFGGAHYTMKNLLDVSPRIRRVPLVVIGSCIGFSMSGSMWNAILRHYDIMKKQGQL